MVLIKKGSTDQTVYFHLRIDSDGKSKTGLVYNSAGAVASYVRTRATRTAITLATLAAANSAHADGGFKEVDGTNAKGLYRLDVPDAAFASGVNEVIIHIGFTDVFEESLAVELVDERPGNLAAAQEVQLNAQGKLDVNAEADTALSDIKLDHLIAVVDDDDPVNDSIIAKMVASDGDWSGFDRDTDALEAIRDRGDAAWITGSGGAITDFVQVVPSIPINIDLANTKTVRLALYLINSLDDLPTTTEITPGTITIERSADGGTSWSVIVNAAACTEQAGQIYYDEVFDSGTGYVSGDMIRITFKSQKITVDANDYEITDATYGWMFHTRIDGGAAGDSASAVADAVWNEATADHVAAGSCGLIIDRILEATEIKQASVNDAAASTTAFVTDLTETDNNFWNRNALIFTSGNNKGQMRKIHTYNGSTKAITLYTALAHAPANSDTFVIVAARNFRTNTADNALIADNVWDELQSGHTIAGSFGKYLDAAISGIGSVVGSGALSCMWTQKDDGGNPMDNCQVWITTDEAGANVVAGSLLTNSSGEATFMLDAGTYYVWREKGGYNFTNPQSWTVS